MKKVNKKIRVVYPGGKIECFDNVAKTFRNAITFMGLERVRALNERVNSINIVSTPNEAKKSKGKPESQFITAADDSGTEYIICTQFATEAKYRKLQIINEVLQSGLRISLIQREDSNSQDDMPTNTTAEELEGFAKELHLTRYERNPRLRRLCIEHFGLPVVCQICGFDFEKTYGKRDIAEPYIEVHHINPHAVVSADGEHYVDCTRDMIPVCANCHRMLHHLRGHLMTPLELKEVISNQL